MYNKSIVCDIDDTISFTTNRDWKNATPNLPLINKLNNLFDDGWEINFYTARGSLSCKTREEAKEKYEKIILDYFEKHNIKFSSVSFEKPLAQYYIDDKAITPQDFLNLEIETLRGGLSGAEIQRRGNKVFKTAKNSLEAAAWYKEASYIIKTIKIHSIIGDTICMDFIKKTDEPTISQIEFIIDKFKEIPETKNFDTYIDRIIKHMNLFNPNYKNYLIDKLNKYKAFYDENKSFCHGDFSLDNMINSYGILYLIDPINPKGLYSSWLLDISKLLHSAYRFKQKTIYNHFIVKYNHIKTSLLLLEITHWIRMRKYSNEKEMIDNRIDYLMKEINVI